MLGVFPNKSISTGRDDELPNRWINRHIHHRKSVNQLLVTSAWYLGHIQSFRAKIMGSYYAYAVADAVQMHTLLCKHLHSLYLTLCFSPFGKKQKKIKLPCWQKRQTTATFELCEPIKLPLKIPRCTMTEAVCEKPSITSCAFHLALLLGPGCAFGHVASFLSEVWRLREEKAHEEKLSGMYDCNETMQC